MEDERIYKTEVKNFDEEDLKNFDEETERRRISFSNIDEPSKEETETLAQRIEGLSGKMIPPAPPIVVPPAFDRIGDWETFHKHMLSYLEIPNAKYSGKNAFNDLLHYTGLRVMCWNLLKYSLRVWLGSAKRHDFEKIAHYAQMAWTRAKIEGRSAPFFDEDEEQRMEFIIKH